MVWLFSKQELFGDYVKEIFLFIPKQQGYSHLYTWDPEYTPDQILFSLITWT